MKTASAPRRRGVTAFSRFVQNMPMAFGFAFAGGGLPRIAAHIEMAIINFFDPRNWLVTAVTAFSRSKFTEMPTQFALQLGEARHANPRVRHCCGTDILAVAMSGPGGKQVAYLSPGHGHRWHKSVVARHGDPLANHAGRRRCRRVR